MLEAKHVSMLVHLISGESLGHLLLCQTVLEVNEKWFSPKVKYHGHCKAKRCPKEHLIERVGTQSHEAECV